MYAEISCKSYYSFLEGASAPHELFAQAQALGIKALAITDRDGLYGMPKAYLATKDFQNVQLLVGAALSLKGHPSLNLLACHRQAYGLLSTLLTESHRAQEKGTAALALRDFLTLMENPGHEGLLAFPDDGEKTEWAILKDIFSDRLWIPLARHLDGFDRQRTRRAQSLSHQFSLKIVATNRVLYHARERKFVQDLLTSIRERTPLSKLGFKLTANAERHLKGPQEMQALFSDLPQALQETMAIAERCHFSPAELRYRYPSEWIPQGESAQSYLEKQVYQGAWQRYPDGIPEAVQKQLRHELQLIAQLSFADYFLTLWEIVTFARQKQILCQGRGSAANSVVCYCLGITAIDPVRMNLLFERFISVERGEPPDIDVDFEHERREEVIQHVYEKYGRHRAAMVAGVITYRERSARRDVCRSLDIPYETFEKDADTSPRKQKVLHLARALLGFPRHLSIHSGGFTLSADPLHQIVPIEPARMEARSIVQWDKYDLDVLGLLKVDLLSLGMLTAIRKALDLVGHYTLATLPPEDPQTYEMIRRADTVGVFQIESRAQMNMSQRLLPNHYYDLVIQIALVRPGPIMGHMVHPYLRRRRGLEEGALPDPRLKNILERTLGVPLFQEQVMKMAIVLANFTPGEADELRRAIGAWRSSGSIERMGKKLKDGLLQAGLPKPYVALIFEQIKGFSEYGFPESHSASFALLAYASAYLKCHHPAAFACALINSQPMGFYAVHTIIDDAKRHGVTILNLDPNESLWDCTLTGDSEKGPLRLGWRLMRHLSRKEAESMIAEKTLRPFTDLTNFVSRVCLRQTILEQMALGDVFTIFGLSQREALWEILRLSSLLRPDAVQQNLFAQTAAETSTNSLFSPLDGYEAVCADYATYASSTRAHPMAALRDRLHGTSLRLPTLRARELHREKNGRIVQAAGLIIVRQRPQTAKGTVFASLEDETGVLDLVLHSKIYERYEKVFCEQAFLRVRGQLQRDGGAVNLIVWEIQALFPDVPATEEVFPQPTPKSHNWG